MAEHVLDGNTPHPFWDRDLPPKLEVEPGDTVIFDCPEPCGQVTPDWTATDLVERYNHDLVHALVGPVYVKGLSAGDTLEVKILKMEHHGWGWSGHESGFGLLADEFDFPYIHHWRITDTGCDFGKHGITVPFAPFCGCVGVAPPGPGRLSTMPPRINGGNADHPAIGPGATFWLPTFADGGLFSLGDCHANQGHGEVAGTGIETPMRVTVRLNIRRDLHVPELQIQTPPQPSGPAVNAAGCHVTTAHGPDLFTNARNATRHMVDWLEHTHDLTRSEALVLCSAVGDLTINEIVDRPNWMVSMFLPLSIFPD